MIYLLFIYIFPLIIPNPFIIGRELPYSYSLFKEFITIIIQKSFKIFNCFDFSHGNLLFH